MNVRLGRSDSKGIEGTYRNAEHHARPAIPLIQAVESVIEGFSRIKFGWVQYHNTHLLITAGRTISLRPFTDSIGTWGIEVGIRHKSPAYSVTPLFNILDKSDVLLFEKFLDRCLGLEENEY